MTNFLHLQPRAAVARREILKWRGHNFHTFCQAYFFGRTDLKLIKKQEKLLGNPGACSPGNFLKIHML